MADIVAGDIQGTIVTTAGAVLPGVTVTITNTATGAARRLRTDERGAFAAPGLPLGPYEVQASLAGFATRRQPALLLNVGQVITLGLELGVARAPETIAVAGTPPAIEITRTHVGSIITSTEIEHQPVRDRNAVSLASIVPGVMFGRILWDGFERSGPEATPHWISQEATHSIQVSTNSYPAEYGGAVGGIVHVVTKSGSNEINGSAVGMKGQEADQFAGSMGGPLSRNRHFAYGIYDDVRYARAHDRNLFLARTDHQGADANRLSLRYTSESTGIGPEAGDASAGSVRAFSATASSVVGSSLFNDARVHVGRDRQTRLRQDGINATRVHFGDTVTWLRGAHKMKTGIDVQLDRPHTSEYSLFAQDEWHVDPALTLNLGIRYDAQTFSGLETSSVRSDYNNFGPRLGLAWTPLGSRFVVRGGYGMVHVHTPWWAVASARPNAIEGAQRSNAVFDAEYENPRVQQASTGFEWEWMPHTALSASYLMVRGDELRRGIDLDSPRLRYHGLAMELTRRFAQGHQYRVSYTVGAVDSTLPATLQMPRHRFVGSAIVSSNRFADRFSGPLESFVEDWTLSGIYTAQSGRASTVPAWISIDPRIARDIDLRGGTRVTILWEAFNLMNRANRPVRDPTFDAPGAQLRVDRRTTQMAVRFSF